MDMEGGKETCLVHCSASYGLSNKRIKSNIIIYEQKSQEVPSSPTPVCGNFSFFKKKVVPKIESNDSPPRTPVDHVSKV